MNDSTNLIVMLTHNDRTVENASELFEKYGGSKAEYWGFKEEGIPAAEMKKLYSQMKGRGKTTVLEVVAYTEPECIAGAEMAAKFGCDILMGTLYFDSVNEICRNNGIKYMPFVGKVTERPSVLDGDIDAMIAEANEYLRRGVYGFDLLGYRYTGDAHELIRRFVGEVNAPVCVAGSIVGYEDLDEIKKVAPFAFTIGGAFFENKFDGDLGEQVDKVCDYMGTS